MTRLVLPGATFTPGQVVVPAAVARHARVARVQVGEGVELLNLVGDVAVGVCRGWSRGACVVEVVEVVHERGEPPAPLVLALAVLHTEAFSWAVEKATELGATAVQPVLCTRVQREGRSERWRRVAAAAVAQCGRSRPPEVREPLPLAAVLEQAIGARWVADPSGARSVDVSPDARAGATVLVGPEGGFTAQEQELIRRENFTGLWLGPRTLRAETAAVAALVVAQVQLGWLARSGAAAPAGRR